MVEEDPMGAVGPLSVESGTSKQTHDVLIVCDMSDEE